MRLQAYLQEFCYALDRRYELSDKSKSATYKRELWRTVSNLCHYIFSNGLSETIPLNVEACIKIGIVHGILQNVAGSILPDDNAYLLDYLNWLDNNIKPVMPTMYDSIITKF